MTTMAGRIESELASIRSATLVDCAILRIRLHDDPEALRIVDALRTRVLGLARAVGESVDTHEKVLDSIATFEEQT